MTISTELYALLSDQAEAYPQAINFLKNLVNDELVANKISETDNQNLVDVLAGHGAFRDCPITDIDEDHAFVRMIKWYRGAHGVDLKVAKAAVEIYAAKKYPDSHFAQRRR